MMISTKMRRNVFTTYDPNLPMGKKFVAVHVQNEDPLYFLVEVKSKVRELCMQISKFLNLLEPELFGLAIKSSGTYIFLDPLEKLSRYAPKPWKTQNNGMDNEGLPLFDVFFRVQFYVDSYLYISDKNAKFYYYHQLRENVLRYEQSMCEERCFLLASYALQADYGNYNPKLHKNDYFNPSHYFPAWIIEELGIEYIQRNLPLLHCDHKGMSKSEAQSMFIREASDPLAAHNFHLYKMVSNKKSSSVPSLTTDTWLAITITGLMIYAAEPSPTAPNGRRLKTRISFFPWSDIGKLSFDKKKFEIRSTGPQSRKFIYYTGSEELARFLLWFSRASHQFHLMVLPKMREMHKREAEINRRKYRENCVSTTSSRTSSSGNSTGTGMSATNPSSNNTSKSVSPFELSSGTSSGSSSADPKKATSDLDISASSVCCGMDMLDGDAKSEDQDQQRISVISNASSNTTSGIASDKMHGLLGEDSDRDDLMESDLLMSLNHHHHRNHNHRAITLSGCSPQPVVSMESLALSEPIDHHRSCHHQNHHHHNHHHHHHNHSHNHHHHHGADKSMGMMGNKKHSISISNIMITSAQDGGGGGGGGASHNSSVGHHSSSSSSCSSTTASAIGAAILPPPTPTRQHQQQPQPQHIKATVNRKGATEVIVVGDGEKKCSKVSLCLNMNEKKVSDGNGGNDRNHDSDNNEDAIDDDDDDDVDDSSSSSYDDVGHNGNNGGSNKNRYGHHGSGKSNVTVLSTILKPEAERLLKQGIEADSVASELLINNDEVDRIDSLKLAELKEFEKAEKEKLILNSLIDNIPPPPTSINDSSDDDSDSDSSSSSSDSDTSDDDDDDDDYHHRPSKTTKAQSPTKAKHYSPLAQEKCIHDTKQTDKNQSSSPTNKTQSTSSNKMANHIYENVPVVGGNPKLNHQLPQAPTTANNFSSNPPKPHCTGFPPTVPLRPYPSLNSVPVPVQQQPVFQSPSITPNHYPHRTGMRIGVSSLSRPNSAQKTVGLAALLQGGCVHSNRLNNQNPKLDLGPACSLLASTSAGSEPNLYYGGSSHQQNQPMKLVPSNKSDSVYDCRPIGGGDHMNRMESTPKSPGQSQQTPAPLAASTFRQFIKNQLGPSSTNNHQQQQQQESPMMPANKLRLDLSAINNSNNNSNKFQPPQPLTPNGQSLYMTPPPSADYQKKSAMEQLSPNTKLPSQTSMSNNSSPIKSMDNEVPCSNCEVQSPPKKTKESRLKELRQRTSDLNLPLITALFNDTSLQLSDRFMDNPPPNKSQSMQHLTPPQMINGGSCGSSSCSSSSSSSSSASSSSSTPSRASPATVERSCTFHGDEAIAKSAMRQKPIKFLTKNDPNNNNSNNLAKSTFIQKSHLNPNETLTTRPISWHMDHNVYQQPNGQIKKVFNQNHHHLIPNQGWMVAGYLSNPQQQQQQQQIRRSSTGNHGPLTNKKLMIQPASKMYPTATIWIDSPPLTG